MAHAGEDGIAAYGVIMYVNFIFIAVFIGLSIGAAPSSASTTAPRITRS